MEALIEEFEAQVRHKDETTEAAKRLNGELTGQGMATEVVQQEVGSRCVEQKLAEKQTC